jgi:hypothetical protein
MFIFITMICRRIASNIPDLSVQLDVFDEQRECDESQSLQGSDGINLNSHLDVFYAILRQVSYIYTQIIELMLTFIHTILLL